MASSVTVALAVLLGAASAEAETMISSTFDTDDDGWFVQAIDGITGEFTTTFPLDYSSMGGNPDGFVSKADPEPNTWFFSAPAKYLGDISQFYNGWLTFDRIELSPVGELFPRNVVGLVGAGLAIVHDVPSPGTGWTPESVTMNEAGWVIFPAEIAVTQVQFLAVLSSVEAFVIQGDTRFLQDDAAGLDNVMLIEVPESSGLVLACLAAIGLLFAVPRPSKHVPLARDTNAKHS